MTKRKQTPLQKYDARLALVRRNTQAKLERDVELTRKAEQDPNLPPDQRYSIFKRLQAWPRIVLGLYRAELAIAQKKKQESGSEEYGDEKPSDAAYRIVGEALGLGADRIHDLCVEGRQHEGEGWPAKPTNSVAFFVAEILRGPVTKVRSSGRKIHGGSIFAPKRHPVK